MTYLAEGKTDTKGEEREGDREHTATPGNSCSRQPDSVVRLPGIFVSNFDPSDVDECDGGSLFDDELAAPRERRDTYTAGCDPRSSLVVHRGAAGASACSSMSGRLFASQRSLPLSSKCSSRLGVGDSGWDGDVSHDGSLSTVSQRDWTGGPCSDHTIKRCHLHASSSVPFSPDRRHSASTAEQKSSALGIASKFGETASQRDDDRTARYLSIASTSTTSTDDLRPTATLVVKSPVARPTRCFSTKSETVGCSSIGSSDDVQRRWLRVRRARVPDVCLSISSSRSLTDIDSAAALTPRQRQRCRRRNHVTEIWINSRHQQHTDDSEVERRVERLLYEIDHSVTDSVDESKIQSQEFEMLSD